MTKVSQSSRNKSRQRASGSRRKVSKSTGRSASGSTDLGKIQWLTLSIKDPHSDGIFNVRKSIPRMLKVGEVSDLQGAIDAGESISGDLALLSTIAAVIEDQCVELENRIDKFIAKHIGSAVALSKERGLPGNTSGKRIEALLYEVGGKVGKVYSKLMSEKRKLDSDLRWAQKVEGLLRGRLIGLASISKSFGAQRL